MKRSKITLVAVVISLGLLFLVPQACSSPVPNRVPVGERFPNVVGESLEGKQVRFPADFAGEPVLLLVGYAQKAQFDADRWLLGLLQGDLDVRVRELPTIPGLFPRMISSTIDNGMRRGIPKEDWGAVVCVYADAGRVVEFTGNENPNNIRVLLLDGEGRVIWFHDRGYSARLIMELKQLTSGGG